MNSRVIEYERRKSEWCDKIQEFIQELECLRTEGKDTTEICRRLETVLEEFWAFRQEFKQAKW